MSILRILVRQLDLMTQNRFEAISAFFHVVTIQEEEQNKEDPLKKVGPMHDTIKTKGLQYSRPLQELSVEWMVKSKARSHFRQYILNKLTKWGFK